MIPEKPVRVLVVDDSALMRKLIAEMLRSEPGIEVAGLARDGAEAVEMTLRLRPDVVTLDVEMPGKSGLQALPEILDACPVPVVMVSALTQEGADVTLAALELGAVDFLPKPGGPRGLAELKGCQDLLVSKVLTAAQSRIRRRLPASSPPRRARVREAPAACVAIGISTGGPQALSQVFPQLKPPIPPVVVVQHMPSPFTGAFAARLSRQCSLPVKEAEDGDRIVPNQILIAPGGRHLVLVGQPPLVRASLTDGPPVSGHRPSIDLLFQSVARGFGAQAVGLLMTGMGRDGVEGCKRILAAGGRTFGQDQDSSVVYGMNKAAFQEGAIQQEFSLDQLPDLIGRFGSNSL